MPLRVRSVGPTGSQSLQDIINRFQDDVAFERVEINHVWLIIFIRERYTDEEMYFVYEEVQPDRYMYRYFVGEPL